MRGDRERVTQRIQALIELVRLRIESNVYDDNTVRASAKLHLAIKAAARPRSLTDGLSGRRISPTSPPKERTDHGNVPRRPTRL